MEVETKTKRLLVAELIDARQQIDELENMISKYKESLEALRQNEERYQLLTTTLNDVIWTMDAAGELTYISPSVEHQSGYILHEVVNKSFEVTMTPASIDNIRKIIEDVSSNLTMTDQGAVTGHVEWEGFKKMAQAFG
jgi:PAS domain-containing protein